MFLAGAIFAIGYGAYRLVSNAESTGYLVAYITLGIALLAEGSSWIRAVRQTRGEANHTKLPLLQYVRESRDPNVKMVLFEDTAALLGIALAFTGVLLGQLTGASVFDPVASIAIGLLLVTVAAWMGHDTSELLVGAAARPAERAAIEQTLNEFDQIEKVIEVLTMVLGPNALLLVARVDFANELTDEEIEQVRRPLTADCAKSFLTSRRCSSTRLPPQQPLPTRVAVLINSDERDHLRSHNTPIAHATRHEVDPGGDLPGAEREHHAGRRLLICAVKRALG